MKNYTLDEVFQILENIGYDVECAACVEIAFTGVTTDGHSCPKFKISYCKGCGVILTKDVLGGLQGHHRQGCPETPY